MTVLDPITDRVRYYRCLNAIEGYSGWAALGITNINIVVLNTTWTEPSTGGGGTNPGVPGVDIPKYAKDNIPKRIKIQSNEYSCITACIAAIYKIYGGQKMKKRL